MRRLGLRGRSLACVVLASVSAAGRAASSPANPIARSAVIVLVDTLRADHVGSYGDLPLTPRIDALAERSLVFHDAYATSTWTRPSVASLFTSRYPAALGVRGKLDALPEAATTLAQVCRAAGLETLAVSTNGNAGSAWGFDRGFSRWRVPDEERSYPGDFGMVPAEVVTREALRLVDALGEDRRFLLFLHYTDPHDPYLPHAAEGFTAPGRFDGSRRQLEELDALSEAERTRADEERVRQLYRGEVRYLDEWVGRLLEGLERRHRLRDTLVVVTADHGEGLWDHGERAHGRKPYEEQVRIPLLVAPPPERGVPPGAEQGTVSLIDLAPTVLAALGIQVPEAFEGRDLLRCGHGRPCPGDPGYAEVSHQGLYFESFRDGRFKVIRNRIRDQELRQRRVQVRAGDTLDRIAFRHFGPGYSAQRLIDHNPGRFAAGAHPAEAQLLPGEWLDLPDVELEPGARLLEIYDLATDPAERDDLAGRAGRADRALAALREIHEHIRGSGTPARSLAPAEVDPDVREELRALGYVDE